MLEQLYKLYLDNGIISDAITYEMFSQSNEQQQQGLYDLGLAQGLFDTTDLNTFKTAWSEKKNASQNKDGESVLEAGTSVQPESPTTPRIPTGETDTAIERTFGKNAVTDFFGDMYRSYKTGVAQGASVDDAFAVFGQGKEVSDEALDDFRQAVNTMQRQGPTDELREYYKDVEKEGGGILGTIKALGNNLGVAPQVLISSMTGLFNPISLGAAATGAAAGAGAGAGLTALSGPGALFGAGTGALGGAFFGASGMLETATTFTELLQKELGDKPFTNENIRDVLEDEEKISRIKLKSVGRGVTIGAIEALTSGLAGRIGANVVKSALPKLITRPASVIASGLIEGAGGAIGERAGMAVAGQEVDAAEIGLEAVGGGPITAAKLLNPLFRLSKKVIPGKAKYIKDGQNITKEFVEEFIEKADDAEIINFEVDILNDAALKQRLENKKLEAKQNVQIEDNFKKVYPNISQEDLNTLIPLQRELDNAKNNPVDTESKEKELKEKINKITNKYANQVESPAAVPDEKQPATGQAVVEGDNQPTELAGETAQAQEETTDQQGQEGQVETEVSETEEVKYTLPEDPKEARKDFDVIDNRKGKAGLEIFDNGDGNYYVENNKTGSLFPARTKKEANFAAQNPTKWDYGEGESIITRTKETVTETPQSEAETLVAQQALENPNTDEATGIAALEKIKDPSKNFNNDSIMMIEMELETYDEAIKNNQKPDLNERVKEILKLREEFKSRPIAAPKIQEQEFKGVIKTEGDTITQRFTKQVKGKTRTNALAPLSVLQEFDIDVEANGIEGFEIVGVREVRRTKDGKKNSATLLVKEGQDQFEVEVDLTPKKLGQPTEASTTESFDPSEKRKEFNKQIKEEVKEELPEIEEAFEQVTENIATANNLKVARNIKAAITGRGRITEGIRSTPLLYVDQALGINNSTVVYDKVFRPVVESYSKMAGQVQDVVDKMDAAINSLGKTNNEQMKSAYKIGIYLVQREHEANTQAGVSSDISPPANEMLTQTISGMEGGFFGSQLDATTLRDLQQQFSDEEGNISLEALEESLNNNERKAIKTIDDLNASLYDKAKTASERRGRPFFDIKDYTHRQVLRNKDLEDVDVLKKSELFVNPSTQAGTIINREKGPRAIQFNPFESTKRGAQETLLDFEMTPAVKKAQDLTSAVTKTFKKGNKGQKDGSVALGQALRELLRITYLRTYQQANNNLSAKAIKEIKLIAYRQLLSSAPRFAAELIGNASMLIAQDGEVIANAYGKYAPFWSKVSAESNLEFIKFLKNLNSSETAKLAGQKGKRMLDIEGQTKYVDDSNFLNLSESPTGMQGPVAQKMDFLASLGPRQLYRGVAKINDFLMGGADRVVARPIWVSRFAYEFKNNVKKYNNEDIDLSVEDLKNISKGAEASKYLSDKKYERALREAVRQADRTSAELVTSGNPLAGAILKNMDRPEGRKSRMNLYRSINKFMANFTLNEYATARFAIGALQREGKISKGEAGRLLAGVLARMSSYVVLYKLFADFMDQMFGAPEEEEKDYKLFTARQIVGAVSTLMFRQNLGNIPSLPINLGIEYINKNYLESLRDGADYNSYENGIVLSLINLDQLGKKSLTEIGLPILLGPLGPAYRSFERTFELAQRTQTRKTQAARDRAKDELINRMTLEAMGQVGLIPLYKDARRITLKKFFDQKGGKTISKTQLRKINPELYKRLYGPDSPAGKRRKRERELRKRSK
tara:strand:- start:1026 stop:6203 length:5178 start_codon:yes stop_codon:yes gene_type:complete